MVAAPPPIPAGGATLAQLGAAPIVLDSARLESPRLTYAIAPGGPRYLRVVARVRVAVPEVCDAGFGYVNVLTDSGASLSIEFEQRCDGGRRTLRWNTVTTYGTKLYSSHGTTASIAVSNYVRLPDGAAGTHGLRFALEQYKGFRFARVAVDPSTKLVPTAEPPYTLDAKLAPAVAKAKLHAPVTLKLTLRNTGSRVARHVGVDVVLPTTLRAPGLRAFQRGWADIPSGASATRSLVVSLARAGRSQPQFSAQSSIGTAQVDGVVTTGDDTSAAGGPAPPWQGTTTRDAPAPPHTVAAVTTPSPSETDGGGSTGLVVALVAAAAVLVAGAALSLGRRRRRAA